jgi:hypothetical protein
MAGVGLFAAASSYRRDIVRRPKLQRSHAFGGTVTRLGCIDQARPRPNDGSRIIAFPRPPAGFDPLAAFSATLEHYGFPSRRGDPNSLERYRRVWARIKDRYKYVEPAFRIGRGRSHRSPKPTFSPDTNWSGGVVSPTAAQSFCGLQAEWIIPNVYPPNQTDEFWIGSWIGLDGYSGAGITELLQAGVGQDVYYLGGSLHRDINAWFEWYPYDPVTITNLPISPGDLVTVILSTPSGKGSLLPHYISPTPQAVYRPRSCFWRQQVFNSWATALNGSSKSRYFPRVLTAVPVQHSTSFRMAPRYQKAG